MSMASLEREILANCKILFCNPKLKMKDILEWSTGNVKAEADDEIVENISSVSVCIKKVNDKRKKK